MALIDTTNVFGQLTQSAITQASQGVQAFIAGKLPIGAQGILGNLLGQPRLTGGQFATNEGSMNGGISNFRSSIGNTNVARPNLFEFMILPPPAFADNFPGLVTAEDARLVSLYGYRSNAPGYNFATHDNFVDFTHRRHVIYDHEKTELNVEIIVDSNLVIRKFFDFWKASIISPQRAFNYPANYSTFAFLNVLNTNSNIIRSYVFTGVYPKVIQDLQFDSSSQGQFLTQSVSFVYETVEAGEEKALGELSELGSIDSQNPQQSRGLFGSISARAEETLRDVARTATSTVGGVINNLRNISIDRTQTQPDASPSVRAPLEA